MSEMMRGMSKRALLLSGAAAALGACASAEPETPAPPPGPTPVERHGALRVSGNKIVGRDGQPVMLRGMSLFWSQWQGQFYNAEAVRWLRQDWNVNVIRAALAPEPGGWIEHPEREMAKIAAVIDAAVELGVYVIVDWHAHRPLTEHAVRFFAEIAQRYGAYPNIIYETWNEPLNTHEWARDIKPHHEQTIAAIRAHDAANLIIAGCSTWSQDVEIAAADPLADENTAYVLHYYAGTHRQRLRDKAVAALGLGKALFVSEYGVTESTGDGPIDVAESRLWWDFMEEHKLSHLQWSIADKDETSAALRPGAAPNGGWPDDAITQSGLMARERLRALN